jgi:hypothetical protein
LQTGQPVISNHLENEQRFRTPDLLVRHGIHRAINVILQGDGRPFGVLEVDSQSEDEFTAHDLTFLQGAANVLGMAIERERQDRSLKAALAHQEVLLKEITPTVAFPTMPGSQPTPARTRKRLSSGICSRILQNSASMPSAVRRTVSASNRSKPPPCKAATPISASISCCRMRLLSARDVAGGAVSPGLGSTTGVGSLSPLPDEPVMTDL